MNFLFWNVGREKLNAYLLDVIIEKDLDVLVLAEYEDNERELLRELSNNGYNYFHINKIACRRIDIFTNIKPSKVQHFTETSYFTIKRIPHPELGLLTFAFVHFPSKLYADEFNHYEEARLFKNDIEAVEDECNSNLTVIAGDLNMNPFEQGMMSSTAIHSYPTIFEASKKKRRVRGRDYNMFYNPMWNFFGDTGKPSGTYHYSASQHGSLYWNLFDQVLVRPPLIEHIFNNVDIITTINGNSLVNEKEIPAVSDHLPILFKI